MVSLSNNGLSNECMKKRPSENGCHTLHFGVTPKHKVRKVWAVRDFPSGCGRNAPKIDLSHKENAVVTISENTSDNSSPLPKNKYCQRRVFAVCDFPPFCGRNAPMPTEQDRLGGTEASKRVVVLHKEVTENESIQTSKNVMGTGTSHMKLTASQEADSLSKIEVTGSKCSLMEQTTVCIENPEDVC